MEDVKNYNMKILFTDDCNGHMFKNPLASLIEIHDKVNIEQLQGFELQQPGVLRMGGKFKDIMEFGNINYTILSSGTLSDYKKKDYDKRYHLISGNY